MEEQKYEIIFFNANWADEMDINSFSIKPLGYLKELLELQGCLFKNNSNFDVYVGSNQCIVFNETENYGSGNSTLENSLYSKELNSEEKNVICNLFSSDSFGYDFLYTLEDYLLDSLDFESLDSEKYPIFYQMVKDVLC